MYSGMRSTSALYPSNPCHKKQSSDNKAQPAYGEHHFEQLNGQLHGAMNPSYSTLASFLMHHNQNNGFGMQQGFMTSNGPFYHSMKNPSYSAPESHPMQQNQNLGFGVQQSSITNNGPLYHQLKDPSYSTPASHPMHQNQNYGFGVQKSSMRNNGPFYHPGVTSHSLQKAPTSPLRQPSVGEAQEVRTYLLPQHVAAQAQGTLTYPLPQPAAAQTQEFPTYLVRQRAAAQAQQVEVMRNAEEEVLEVKLETPVFSMRKPRLKWTHELHERFIRAATQLGGVFKATPKAILEKMKVKGLTLDHIKSHLQKMRCRTMSAEEIMIHGIQNNANSYAPLTEDEVSSSYGPKNEPDFGQYGSLLRSSEIPNYQQNLRIALGEDHANEFDIKSFNLC